MKRTFGYRFLEPSALARLKSLSMIARGVVEGFVSGLHASPYKGFSVEFAEHREYSPGDNPRHLDWRTLARTDRLYVKQYEEETNLRARILLDTSSSMLYRSGSELSKLEYGSYLAAILAHFMMRQQDAVGLSTFDTDIRVDMPAHSSARHLGEMMRVLEGTTAQLIEAQDEESRHDTNIANTLHRLADRFKRRCLIILISDLYDDPDSVARALVHMRHCRHEVIVFHVLDKAEIEFPFRETMSYLDMETGEKIQIDPMYVRDEYRRQVVKFIDGYRKCCAECTADYVMTDTTVPYDFMLSRYLSKRSRL